MAWNQEMVKTVVEGLVWFFFVGVSMLICSTGMMSIVKHFFEWDWKDNSYLVGGIAFVVMGLLLALFLWYITLPHQPSAAPNSTPLWGRWSETPF